MLLIAYMVLPNVLLKHIIGRYALDHLADINFLRFSAVFQENMQDGWLKLQWNVHYIILIEVQVFH
jgi:hypothetical protein